MHLSEEGRRRANHCFIALCIARAIFFPEEYNPEHDSLFQAAYYAGVQAQGQDYESFRLDNPDALDEFKHSLLECYSKEQNNSRTRVFLRLRPWWYIRAEPTGASVVMSEGSSVLEYIQNLIQNDMFAAGWTSPRGVDAAGEVIFEGDRPLASALADGCAGEPSQTSFTFAQVIYGFSLVRGALERALRSHIPDEDFYRTSYFDIYSKVTLACRLDPTLRLNWAQKNANAWDNRWATHVDRIQRLEASRQDRPESSATQRPPRLPRTRYQLNVSSPLPLGQIRLPHLHFVPLLPLQQSQLPSSPPPSPVMAPIASSSRVRQDQLAAPQSIQNNNRSHEYNQLRAIYASRLVLEQAGVVEVPQTEEESIRLLSFLSNEDIWRDPPPAQQTGTETEGGTELQPSTEPQGTEPATETVLRAELDVDMPKGKDKGKGKQKQV